MKYITYGYCEYTREFTLGFAFVTKQEAENEIKRLRKLKSEAPSCNSFEDQELEEHMSDYQSGRISLEEINNIGFEKFTKAQDEWSGKFLVKGMSDNNNFDFEGIKTR